MMTGSLPRRYARALMDLAREEKKVEEFGQVLEGFVAVLEKDPEILKALSEESFETSKRLAAVEEISQAGGFPQLFRNFLLLLIRKNRIALLPHIFREYRRLADEILGILRVTVTTPYQAAPEFLNRVEKMIEQKLKKKVVVHSEIRPGIIGGVVLKIGHVLYDGSVQRELENLRETMLRA